MSEYEDVEMSDLFKLLEVKRRLINSLSELTMKMSTLIFQTSVHYRNIIVPQHGWMDSIGPPKEMDKEKRVKLVKTTWYYQELLKDQKNLVIKIQEEIHKREIHAK